VKCMINVEIGTEALQFSEKEYIKGIFVAVCTVLVHLPPHFYLEDVNCP
jgi:hypothetical protein